jgi:hypothetical protein
MYTVCTLINHCYTVCTPINHCYTVCTLINHCYTVCTLINHCYTVCTLINRCYCTHLPGNHTLLSSLSIAPPSPSSPPLHLHYTHHLTMYLLYASSHQAGTAFSMKELVDLNINKSPAIFVGGKLLYNDPHTAHSHTAFSHTAYSHTVYSHTAYSHTAYCH